MSLPLSWASCWAAARLWRRPDLLIWNIRCSAKMNSAGMARHLCVIRMSSGNFGKNLAKIRAFVTKVKASYALKVGKAPKSERPPGEEIRRALLISIGSLGGGGAANPVRGRWEEEMSPDR